MTEILDEKSTHLLCSGNDIESSTHNDSSVGKGPNRNRSARRITFAVLLFMLLTCGLTIMLKQSRTTDAYGDMDGLLTPPPMGQCHPGKARIFYMFDHLCDDIPHCPYSDSLGRAISCCYNGHCAGYVSQDPSPTHPPVGQCEHVCNDGTNAQLTADGCMCAESPRLCTMDVKTCPDGKYVSRDPDNSCEFYPCAPPIVGQCEHVCNDGTKAQLTADGCVCAANTTPMPPLVGQCEHVCNDGTNAQLTAYGCVCADTPQSCTADVMRCPDGKYVSRDPKNGCEFDPCLPTARVCTTDVKTCSNGEYVSRDPNNNCEFGPCVSTGLVCTADVKTCTNGKSVSRDPNNNCKFAPCGPTYVCTEDALKCPNGKVVSRDPKNDCKFHPCVPTLPSRHPWQCEHRFWRSCRFIDTCGVAPNGGVGFCDGKWCRCKVGYCPDVFQVCRPEASMHSEPHASIASVAWTTLPGTGSPPAPMELEMLHGSKFGLAPQYLELSGWKCHSGFGQQLNGKYTFGGLTGEGRPWYKHYSPDLAGEHAILYYDREYDGPVGGEDDKYGVWILNDLNRAIDLARAENIDRRHALRGGMPCFAKLYQELGACGAECPVDMLDSEPGAVPPRSQIWKTYCGGHTWGYQPLTFEGKSVPKEVLITGQWRYQRSAMPSEKVNLRHGKASKTTSGSSFNIQGTTNVAIGGKVGMPVFGPSADTNVKASISASFKHDWSKECSTTTEEEISFVLPQTGSALWQWVLTAHLEGDNGDVLTRDYAFTPNRAHPPRCYPGFALDQPAYQKCEPGYDIS